MPLNDIIMTPPTLLDRSLNAVWHPCTQMKAHLTLPLVPIARGEGPWLYDTAGNRYLDAISSWWVNLFGHANERINGAIRDQLEKIEHVMLAGFTHEPVVALSERLSARTESAYGEPLGHAFYASDGASATEIALKMSLHYWRNTAQPQKTRFMSLSGGYHGETIGALAVTDVPLFRDAYSPLLINHHLLPSPVPAPGQDAEEAASKAADLLAQHLAEHHSQTAAFILEPQVQCANQMAMYHPLYLRRARALCDQYGVHLIADEIAVGFGRTGRFFATEGFARPDFICLSKGLSGGYLPLSVVLTRDEIYQAFYDDATARGFLHSHSYTGNPLACRAALATLDIFDDDQVIEANRQRAHWLLAASQPLAEHEAVKNFRHCGMIFAFDVATQDTHFPKKFFAQALKHALLLRPIGNTVYFMPPYVLDEASCHWLGQQTLHALNATLSKS
jgi:adenosylmethionine-8-amino-7-oxononanoate aminotransferase